MKKIIRFICILTILSIFLFNAFTAAPPVTSARQNLERYKNDPLAVRSIDPTFDQFPDSSLIDFSYNLDPPAGKYGFVKTGDDGHFHFEKTGKRIRFWGVTVASSHLDIPKEKIYEAVDVIARSGCNLLRLHEIDNRGAEKYNLVRRNIIDEAWPNNDNSRHFDPEYRDRVDYWIHCAKEKGMYVYLVIKGYRTFRIGDGVAKAEKLDRKAKPYGFFNSRLLDLQDEYIDAWLFKHKNPYTGLPNGLDPAVCMLEIENEDSLFFNPEKWTTFIEPYKSDFEKLWNEWLEEKYGTTEKLRFAWSLPGTEWSALTLEETLDDSTIQLPLMKMRWPKSIKPLEQDSPLSHPLRQSDGARFAVHLQRQLFIRQRDLIRSKGCPIPLTAVVNSELIPDTWSVIQELDFTGENAYQDHPAFKSGEFWVGKSFYKNESQLKNTGPWGMPPFMARYKWAGKPLVCREWANCWPNIFRTTSNLAMAAQGLLQDYDALIHFAYYTWGDFNKCSPFGIQSDPARWGNFGYAADLFINGYIAPANKLVEICYTEKDLFQWGHYVDHLHTLAWDTRIQNRYFSGAVQSDADLRISSGRSGTGLYMGINNLLWDSGYNKCFDYSKSSSRECIFFSSGYRDDFIFKSEDFTTTSILKAGYIPIFDKDKSCNGFLDPELNNIVLREKDSKKVAEVARGFLETLKKKNTPLKSIPIPETIVSDTGAVLWDLKNTRLVINTPVFKTICGEFKKEEEIKSGNISAISQSPVASIVMLSLDGKPITESDHFSIKMTSVAYNRGQLLTKVEKDNLPGNYLLEYPGSTPVQTHGKASENPTVIKAGDKILIEAYLENGTWEAIFKRKENEIYINCDTPNIRFRIGEAAFGKTPPDSLYMIRYFNEFPPTKKIKSSRDIIYPGFHKYIKIAP
jgi:hypothetical protein